MTLDESLQDNDFLNWTTPGGIDFNTLLPQSSSGLQGVQEEDSSNGGSTTPALSSSTSDDETTDPVCLCTSKLTELLLDLGRLWAKLPMKTTLHLPQRNSHEAHVKNLTDKIASKAVLEKLFALAQRLIDLYPDAISLAVPPDTAPPPACDIPVCTHALDLPPALEKIEQHVSARHMALKTDLALANVLVSCHIRLLDILDCFFLLVTACLRVTVASPERREPEFDGPDMRVGSFVPPKTAAVSMQIALLKHLMVGLSEKLTSFGVAVSSRAAGPDDGDLEVHVVTVQHQMLTKRHASSIAHVDIIEDFMMRFDIKKL